jgi:hypothetical protein
MSRRKNTSKYWNDRFATETAASNENEFEGKKLPRVPEYRTLNGGVPKPVLNTRSNINFKRSSAPNARRSRSTPVHVIAPFAKYNAISRIVNSDVFVGQPKIQRLLNPVLSVDINASHSVFDDNDLLEDSYSSSRGSGPKSTHMNSASSFVPIHRIHAIGKGNILYSCFHCVFVITVCC